MCKLFKEFNSAKYLLAYITVDAIERLLTTSSREKCNVAALWRI